MRLLPQLAMSALILSLITGTAASQGIVEFDFDGVLGNGPDTVLVAIGDSASVDVRFVGTSVPMSHLKLVLCHQGGIEFLDAVYDTPDSWYLAPPDLSQPGCLMLEAADFGSAPITTVPRRVATITLHSVENAKDEIICDLSSSYYHTFDFEQHFFDGQIGVVVCIGSSTPTDYSTWTELKRLFR